MSDFTPPLRKIVRRDGSKEYLECGHEQPKKYAAAIRRRCVQCRRAHVTVAQKTEAAEGTRCPYCFDDFSNTEEETWTCPKCHTKLHGECHDENDGCTALGCHARAPISVRPRTTPTVIQQPVIQQPVTVDRSAEDEYFGRNQPPIPERHWFDGVLASAMLMALAIIPIWMGCDYGLGVGIAMAIGLSYMFGQVGRWRGWKNHSDDD